MNSNLIYDLGMHIGQDTDFYLAKGFSVIAIEANPLLAEEQAKRFASFVAEGRLKILNVGIGPKSGEFPFYVNDFLSEWSSFDKEIGTREGKYHEIMVQTLPLKNVIKDFGMPYYLKVDIEGYDYPAVESIESSLNKPKFVSVENGQKPLLDLLSRCGYERFKFINQQIVPQQKCPFPAREGKYIDYEFPHGSSGLFGDESPGEWLPYAEVLEQIEAYWNNPDRDANIHGWFDLHAMRFG